MPESLSPALLALGIATLNGNCLMAFLLLAGAAELENSEHHRQKQKQPTATEESHTEDLRAVADRCRTRIAGYKSFIISQV